MSTEIATTEPRSLAIPDDPNINALIEAISGDISKLPQEQKLKYLVATCKSVGLNPLTKPFDLISFQGKTVMYANKGCAEQLRKLYGVSIEIVERKVEMGCLIVRARAKDNAGRTDEAIAAVPFAESFAGDVKANAMMKCETKAKRRVTLSICGLGLLDVSEIEDGTPERQVEVITGQPTAEDRAKQLNAMLTDGEKATAINTESHPGNGGDGQPHLPQASIQPQTESTEKPLPVSPSADISGDFIEVCNLAQNAIVTANIKTTVLKYLVAKQGLKADGTLDDVAPGFKEKAVKNQKKFIDAVLAWAKTQEAR